MERELDAQERAELEAVARQEMNAMASTEQEGREEKDGGGKTMLWSSAMMEEPMDPFQVVLILDVAQVPDGEVLPRLPAPFRARWARRLSEDAQIRPAPPGAMAGPYDWDRLAGGVAAMAKDARELAKEAGSRLAFYALGRAPLPLFVQLGYTLNKFSGEVRVLNPYRGGEWLDYPTAPQQGGGGTPFFEIHGLREAGQRPNDANGVVAVYVSTIGAPTPTDAFQEALRRTRHNLAGVVEIVTRSAADVTPQNAGQVAAELASALPRVNDSYPRAEGTALFVAGPVQLAFMVGRALNFHAQRDISVMNFDRGGPDKSPGYEVAVTLPLRVKARIPSAAPEDQLARRQALDVMIEAVSELKGALKKEDFPPAQTAATTRRHLTLLKDLEIEREAEGDAFGLSIVHRRMTVGRMLLDAIRGEPPDTIRRFAQLLVLHELYHDDQDVRTSNYAEIGRAGVVLEEIDFWADAFALDTLTAWDVRMGGPRAQADVRGRACAWIDAAISGIEAFDRLEQGTRIEKLYERRLRRYLIWHLQHERAATVRSRDDLRELFGDRLFAELAPLEGALDPRGDKVVDGALSGRTEAFAVVRGRLLRRGPRPGFEPSGLVEAVRQFDRAEIRRTLRVLVEEGRSVLAAWTER